MDDEHILWRIARGEDCRDDNVLSGQSAAQKGGRWNSPGRAMVYASASAALAALETVANLAPGEQLHDAFLVRISVPAALWQARLEMLEGALPAHWKDEPPGQDSQHFGDRWLDSCSSAIMMLPSVIVPEERNALINPGHPMVCDLSATVVRQFRYAPH